MPSTPQPILDALSKVQSDADAQAAAVADDGAKADALASAAHAKEVSAASVSSTTDQKKADLAAALTLISSTYA